MAEMDLTRSSGPSGHRFNYRGQHRYIVTMRTARGEHLFVEREIVLRLLTIVRETCWKHQFVVHAYCCLPYELILVVGGKGDRSDLKAFLRTLRETSRKEITAPGGTDLWHRTYTERVLRKKEDIRDVIRSVFTIPVKRGLAARPQDYPFSGSFEQEQVFGKERRE